MDLNGVIRLRVYYRPRCMFIFLHAMCNNDFTPYVEPLWNLLQHN